MFSKKQDPFNLVYQRLRHDRSVKATRQEIKCVMSTLIAKRKELLEKVNELYPLRNERGLSKFDFLYEFLLNYAMEYIENSILLSRAVDRFGPVIDKCSSERAHESHRS